MNRLRVMVLAAVLLAACEGPAGPVGPAGPPGPQGPPGSPNRVEISGPIPASRSISMNLPAEAVANGRLPGIACYISDDRRTWLSVSYVPTSSSSAYCGFTGIGSASPTLTIINVPSGWYYHLIAFY